MIAAKQNNGMLRAAAIWGLRPERMTANFWRRVGEGVIVYPNLALNPVAATIWDCCDGKKCLREITQHIASHYSERTTRRIELDVLYVIFKLADAGALRFSNEPTN